MSKGISRYDDAVPMDIGVIAGNLKKRDIWQCLNCPKAICDGCPISKVEDIKWNEVKHDNYVRSKA